MISGSILDVIIEKVPLTLGATTAAAEVCAQSMHASPLIPSFVIYSQLPYFTILEGIMTSISAAKDLFLNAKEN